ncbi:glycosyl hydrolase [Tropicimonas sp. IMCC6043]|uniref:glycosyl hydrolase n=1 Tax=Tropicimonas sp. IMCC6043 TaxID=2510645 RepID=UPI00101BF804|nr:glycosyl hydrolase [Tropicimonas sp. IMCC6043]RYH11773.1 glycosyl hydrolase [Tropicimonas sp. IMCC6043]
MYASHGFLRSDIGDVDVVYHDGRYHLFHLVLPNHDFIAHAVSKDGMTWRRVRNALFVGDPGSWDDDMLWTMHVSPDPEQPGAWRMFYTGLSRAEYGRVQRVGLARSEDLYTWTKDESAGYPLEISGAWYESRVDEGRKWVSFRDPFFYRDAESGAGYLLAAARTKDGPIIRRGCVGVARETAPDQFEFESPLHRPGLYDDVEVPNLIEIGGRFYLIGSIREDTKIHYWYADDLRGPFWNFSDNVLLPKGNYAGRICRCGDKVLLFNFFQRPEIVNGREVIARLLPPPKELVADDRGRLIPTSFYGFDELVRDRFRVTGPAEFSTLFRNPHATISDGGGEVHVSCESGYEAFLVPGEHENFRLRARLQLEGIGKCGLVLRVSEEGDGYFLALDLVQGYAQLRRWGANPNAEFEHAFNFATLQSGSFLSHDPRKIWDIEIVAHGSYLEFSMNGQVTLCVADETYGCGRLGFYTESAKIRLEDITVETLHRAMAEEETVYTSTRHSDMPSAREIPIGP